MAGAGQTGMMARIQKMQEEMAQAQQSLEAETVEVSVGGGAVVITMTGHQRVQSVKIDKTTLDMEDEDWLTDLQDLLAAAFNQAVEQSQSMAAERMEGITGGLDTMLPGGLGGLFG
ncbi:MAG: YbaB/EbfC family nucleoid-associated protein [Deltaproteobacteria bacterium]|nr:YbaB/EbfC family nucleoid-associated protein [Candidatus Kapabacteria bacterium]